MSGAPRPRIVIACTDAGGGHRATAQALAALLGDGAETIIVNPYREALAHLDLFDKVLRVPGEELYNRLMLRRGLAGPVELLFRRSLLLNIRMRAADGRRALTALWARLRPDLVISVMPWLNGLIAATVAGQSPAPRLAIMPTDMEQTWPRQWFPAAGSYSAICGTEALARAAAGRPVHRTTGLLIRDGFRPLGADAVAAGRASLGLAPDRPTLAILYGGHGSRRMLQLARALGTVRQPVQALFLCGHNAELARAIRACALPYPHHVAGYSDRIAGLLGLGDLFVGKPGPGAVSEALALGLPVLLDAARVLPQERCNLRWARAEGYGEAFTDMRSFAHAVERLAAGGMAEPSRRARGHTNRAAAELPGIIAGLLGAPI